MFWCSFHFFFFFFKWTDYLWGWSIKLWEGSLQQTRFLEPNTRLEVTLRCLTPSKLSSDDAQVYNLTWSLGLDVFSLPGADFPPPGSARPHPLLPCLPHRGHLSPQGWYCFSSLSFPFLFSFALSLSFPPFLFLLFFFSVFVFFLFFFKPEPYTCIESKRAMAFLIFLSPETATSNRFSWFFWRWLLFH